MSYAMHRCTTECVIVRKEGLSVFEIQDFFLEVTKIAVLYVHKALTTNCRMY